MAKAGLVPADHPETETDRAKIMQWIMDERLLELAGEGHRWPDLRRWQLAGKISLNNAFFSSKNPSINFDPSKNLVFPIPTSEIDLNPNIVQNPGY